MVMISSSFCARVVFSFSMSIVLPFRCLVARLFLMSFSVIFDAAAGETFSFFARLVTVAGRSWKACISFLEIICKLYVKTYLYNFPFSLHFYVIKGVFSSIKES